MALPKRPLRNTAQDAKPVINIDDFNDDGLLLGNDLIQSESLPNEPAIQNNEFDDVSEKDTAGNDSEDDSDIIFSQDVPKAVENDADVLVDLSSEVDEGLLSPRPVRSSGKGTEFGVKYENYGTEKVRRTAPLHIEEKAEKKSVLEQAYKKMGEITLDQALYEDYEIYAHLEPAILEATQYIQALLTETGKSKTVGEARRDRNSKLFRETSAEIDRLVLRHINNDGIKGVSAIDVPHFLAAVNNEILGFGPLEPLWSDGTISEVMVNGPHEVRVEINGKLVVAKGIRFRDADHLLTTAQQMLGLMNRRIDVQNPYADGTLPDGSRINVTHTEIAPKGPFMTIRRFPDTVFSMRKLVAVKSMTEDMAEFIGNLVNAGVSIIAVGGTGTGKTSMLNALSGCIPNDDRVITIEDTIELRLNPNKHVIGMQARPASSNGGGAVTIRDLVRNALRQRPDRVIVGEVRDASAYDMMQAMNTGHEGSLTTVHANDAAGGVERISLLVSESGEINPERALSLIAGGVDAFIVIKRYEDGSRRVRGIYEVPSTLESRDGKLYLEPIPIWEFVQDEAELLSGKVIGHYEQFNEISESLTRKHALDKKKHLSLEELYEMSDVQVETD